MYFRCIKSIRATGVIRYNHDYMIVWTKFRDLFLEEAESNFKVSMHTVPINIVLHFEQWYMKVRDPKFHLWEKQKHFGGQEQIVSDFLRLQGMKIREWSTLQKFRKKIRFDIFSCTVLLCIFMGTSKENWDRILKCLSLSPWDEIYFHEVFFSVHVSAYKSKIKVKKNKLDNWRKLTSFYLKEIKALSCE